MDAELKQVLNELSVWEEYSSPNGGAYREQRLPKGVFDTPLGRIEIRYSWCGCYILVTREDGDVVYVHNQHTSVGPGVDFGKYYCTRDQALTELL